MSPLLRRIVDVPDTWEAWVQRVMTIVAAAVLVAAVLLLVKVGQVQTYIEQSRLAREHYQVLELERQCAILVALDTPVSELGRLGC